MGRRVELKIDFRWKVWFYPFIIFLIVFVLDKFAILEPIQKAGRTDNTGLENIRDGMDLIWKNKLNSPNNKKSVVVFGTSRSERLKFNHPDNLNNFSPISEREKNLIKSIDLETRLTDRGSEFLYNLFLLKAMLEQGYKPDLVLFELSPEMMNANSYSGFHYQFTSNIFPFDFLIYLYNIVEWEWKKKIIHSILFPSAYYKFQPNKAITNAIKGEDYKTHNTTFPILQHFPQIQPLSTDYQDIPIQDTNSEEYQSRIVNFSEEMFQMYFFKDYEFSQTEYNLFLEVLKIAKESSIPFLFWRPRIHPYYNRMIEERIPISADNIYAEETAKQKLNFVNLQDHPFSCDAFSDSSHLSSRCSPELLTVLLKESGLFQE